MSVLRRGDESMHYPDGSHRWLAPDPALDQRAWEDRVREHQRQHIEAWGTGRVRRSRAAAPPPGGAAPPDSSRRLPASV